MSNNLGKYDLTLRVLIGVLHLMPQIFPLYTVYSIQNFTIMMIYPYLLSSLSFMIFSLSYLLPIHFLLLLCVIQPQHHPAFSAHRRFLSAHPSL